MDAKKRKIINDLREINGEAKRFRELHPESPLNGIAFKVSALCGQIEAQLRANGAGETPNSSHSNME